MEPWQKAALSATFSATKFLVQTGASAVKQKIGERVDRARRQQAGIGDFHLVEVAGLPKLATYLPPEYLFWMGLTLDGFRRGSEQYAPQKFGGYWPDAQNDSSERKAEFWEFNKRLAYLQENNDILLFWDGQARLVDRDCAITTGKTSNLRIAHEKLDEIFDLPACLVRRAINLQRLRNDQVIRLELWNKQSFEVGLASFAPYQSMDDESDDLLIELSASPQPQKRR